MKNTYHNISSHQKYPNKDNTMALQTIDMHTSGEPLRVILRGYPKLEGNTILDYRNFFKSKCDTIRTVLMHEPRGHADMYGCLLCPPEREDSDFGILFLHNEGYSTMCGHAIIAISTLAAEMPWFDVKEGKNELKIDAPCGQITSFVFIKNGSVEYVRFQCVPSFVVELDLQIEVSGLGVVTYDLAYGGAFYAYVDMQKNKNLSFSLESKNIQKIITTGMDIKNTIMQSNQEIKHPFEPDLSFLYGTIFIDQPKTNSNHSRNVCIFADGEVDRCPTGSGVSGRMAVHHERGEVGLDETISIESVIDTVFEGKVIKETSFGDYSAIIPEVTGTAYVTGQHTFIIDPADPLRDGFLLK